MERQKGRRDAALRLESYWIWLQRNMPRTAEKIFRELRAGPSPAA